MGLARALTTATVVALTGAGFLLGVGASPASADPTAEPGVPAGFRVVTRSTVAAGVERLDLVRERPPLAVHVARIAPDAAVTLRAVLSNDEVAGQDPIVERTSSMCERVHCLLAVNGDFAGGDDEPLGGLLTGGELLRTPSPSELQLSVGQDGTLSAGELGWSGTLVPTDLQPLTLAGVNVAAAADGLTLYTTAFGADTPPPAGPTTLLSLRNVEPAGALRVGQTTMVEITGLTEELIGSTPGSIPADGGVLAGRGPAADALRALWSRVQGGRVSSRALLRLDTAAGVAESLGGSPILIRNGARWFADAANDFTRGRQPRTMVGWNPAGERLLVTVDGRQPEASVGMTLGEAADLLLSLGATDGINLDGGGSTTFVTGGEVVNTPSDVAVRRGSDEVIQHLASPGQQVIGHVERPVTSALVVVAKNEVTVPPIPAQGGAASGLTQALTLAARSSTDPGSVPAGSVPALVVGPEVGFGGALRLTAVVADAIVAAALAVLFRTRRRRGHRPTALAA
ncbi:MAG TPA: phosphodiester glycosidase family protein [Acidimicrobiia bacterium]|nr:phosphodiester glycosidase family protein [Acidimicrobiia bacterium]